MNNKDSTSNAPRGILLIVSSPSGAGKTTLCHKLLDEFEDVSFSVSYTTRPMRPNETGGVDYHFVTQEAFDRMVAEGQFAEWAHVHGHRYGTSKKTISAAIDHGRDLVFDIDYQGATQLRTKYAQDTVTVFVLPPSMLELARRLRSRGTDAADVVERRLAKAADELEHYDAYDYLIVNDDLERAYWDLRAIYMAAHCVAARRARSALTLLDEVRQSKTRSK